MTLLSRTDEYTTSFDHLWEAQQRACQIVLRCSSVLSIFGSSFIVYNLLGPKRNTELRNQVFSRLLLGLSISDVFSSLALFMGAWPIPRDSFHSDSLYGNRGTQLTCDLQGLFIQIFYFSSIFYTASLSLYFLFYVKFQWTEQQVKSKTEPWLHTISWLVPLSLAVPCQIFDMYNPTAFFCYVVTYPVGCDHYEDVDCIRGSNIWFWRSLAQIFPFAVCFGTICGSMRAIYVSVRKHEMAAWGHSEAWAGRWARDSRLAFRTAAQYIGAFLVVWVPMLIVALCEDLGLRIPFSVWVIDALMIPLVGFLNAIVYSRSSHGCNWASVVASICKASRSPSLGNMDSRGFIQPFRGMDGAIVASLGTTTSPDMWDTPTQEMKRGETDATPQGSVRAGNRESFDSDSPPTRPTRIESEAGVDLEMAAATPMRDAANSPSLRPSHSKDEVISTIVEPKYVLAHKLTRRHSNEKTPPIQPTRLDSNTEIDKDDMDLAGHWTRRSSLASKDIPLVKPLRFQSEQEDWNGEMSSPLKATRRESLENDERTPPIRPNRIESDSESIAQDSQPCTTDPS